MGDTAVNLGPLTTTFTAPQSCETAFLFRPNTNYYSLNFVLQGICTGIPNNGSLDPACFPSGAAYVSTYDDARNVTAIITNVWYSPGLVCPNGYGTGYSQAYGQSGTLTDLAVGETAVMCCPSGMTWAFPFQCFPTTEMTAPGATCGTGSKPISPEILTFPSLGVGQENFSMTSGQNWLFGNHVQLRWKASDLSLATQTGAASPTPGVEGSKGLSTGAKAAIGTVIPVVVIVVLIGLFFYFRRRARHRRGERNQILAPEQSQDHPQKPELEGDKGTMSLGEQHSKAELDANTISTRQVQRNPLAQDDRHPQAVEADSSPINHEPVSRAELQAQDQSHTTISQSGAPELYSNPIAESPRGTENQSPSPLSSHHPNSLLLSTASGHTYPAATSPNEDERTRQERLTELRKTQARLAEERSGVEALLRLKEEERRVADEIRKLEGG